MACIRIRFGENLTLVALECTSSRGQQCFFGGEQHHVRTGKAWPLGSGNARPRLRGRWRVTALRSTRGRRRGEISRARGFPVSTAFTRVGAGRAGVDFVQGRYHGDFARATMRGCCGEGCFTAWGLTKKYFRRAR